MKKKPLLVLPVLAVLAGVLWLTLFRNDEDPGRIRVSGNIEVTDVPLSFKIPGRLAERLVEEGETVQSGQVVARLDPVDQELRLSQARAERAQAQAVLAETEAGSRPQEIARARARRDQARFVLDELEAGSRTQEIADATAALDRALAAKKSAESTLRLAEADLKRFKALYEAEGISRREFETVETRYDTARNAATEADAAVKSAQQQLSLRKEGPRTEKIRQAKAALSQAEAELALMEAGPREEVRVQARARAAAAQDVFRLAQQNLAETKIAAPFNGVVLSKSAEPGAFLNPGTPVVTIGRLDRPWLRAYVPETELGKVRLGMKAAVSTDTYPDRTWEGKISFISSEAEFTPRSVQTFEERVKLVYRIKIDLPNPDGALKPGMPADAEIAILP